MNRSARALSTRERLRDGALATLALALLVAALGVAGRLDALFDPAAAAVGVLGSYATEWVLLRYPDRTRELWGRHRVRAGAVALTVGGGVALLWLAGARSVAVLSWGLLAYLVLLGFVLHGRNPVAWLVDANGKGDSGQS